MRSRSPARRARRWILSAGGCVTICLGIPIACVLIFVYVYAMHNRPIRIAIPTPPPLANNAYNDFVRASKMIRAIPHKAPASMPNPPTTRAAYYAEVAACAKEAAPSLAVIRRALTKPCQAPPVRSFNTPFLEFAGFREVAREITGVAEYYDLAGQPNAAADVLLDGDEMAIMFSHRGALISGLVSGACEAICLRELDPLIPRLSPAELARVAARLDRIASKRVAYAEILVEEKWETAAGYAEAFNDPKGRTIKAHYEFVRSMMDEDTGARSKARRLWITARFALADKEAMIRQNMRYMDALAAEARGPYAPRSNVPLPDNLLAEGISVGAGARAGFVAREAAFDLVRVEVALYRYRADHGRFADSLSELAPGYIAAVPDDPFGGPQRKPLLYRPLNGGGSFLLYSRGVDMVDNGGIPSRNPVRSQGADIVAGRLWPPVRIPIK